MEFAQEDLQTLRERAAAINGTLPEDWHVHYERAGWSGIYFAFDFGDLPDVDPVSNYLDAHYDVNMSHVPGRVELKSVEAAHNFLDRVEAQEPVNYAKVLKCANNTYWEGLREAQYTWVEDDADPELDEIESDGTSYWMEELNVFNFMVTTITWARGYSGWTPTPKDDPFALQIYSHFDDGESEVDMEWILKNAKIEEGSLEELLVDNLLVTRHDYGHYAYIDYALAASVWLSTEPENLGEFPEALESIKETYQDRDYKVGTGWYNPREQAAREWLLAVQEKIAQEPNEMNREDYLTEFADAMVEFEACFGTPLIEEVE